MGFTLKGQMIGGVSRQIFVDWLMERGMEQHSCEIYIYDDLLISSVSCIIFVGKIGLTPIPKQRSCGI